MVKRGLMGIGLPIDRRDPYQNALLGALRGRDSSESADGNEPLTTVKFQYGDYLRLKYSGDFDAVGARLKNAKKLFDGLKACFHHDDIALRNCQFGLQNPGTRSRDFDMTFDFDIRDKENVMATIEKINTASTKFQAEQEHAGGRA